MNRLSPEIRLQIWLRTIPDDEEEVCLPWPCDRPDSTDEAVQPIADLPVLPLTVDTGFPVAMHVCRESRELVQNQRLSGVRFRASQAAQCMTPFRRFRPELDILYLDQESRWHLDLFLDPNSSSLGRVHTAAERRDFKDFMDILSHVKRLAVPIGLGLKSGGSFTISICDFFIYHVRRPESIVFVLPYTTPQAFPGQDLPDRFVAPGKRCRLITVPTPIDKALLIGQRERYSVPVTAIEAVAEAYGQIQTWCEDEPGGVEMLSRLTLKTQVFVEYQKDGKWLDVCKDRMYASWCHPSSRRFIPVNRRPNPELVRVHDTDVVFAPTHNTWVHIPYKYYSRVRRG